MTTVCDQDRMHRSTGGCGPTDAAKCARRAIRRTGADLARRCRVVAWRLDQHHGR